MVFHNCIVFSNAEQSCSPPKGELANSSSGSLGSSEMESTSLPTASSPHVADDAAVGPQGGLGQEEVAQEAPQGDLPDSGRAGGKTPRGSKPDPCPDSIPEPSAVPKSGKRPLRKKGKTPVSFVQPEAPDSLLEALNSASIEEEHRTVMSAVIQKVRSAKSGLTEACTSLLTGFDVSI